MENNKKKKYYQYHKNNNHHNYYNYNKHNRYYYKKKKKNHENNYINIDKDINMENVNVGNINHDVIREDNINVNNSNIESDINKKVLYIDENIDYNEYEGLLKKKVVNLEEKKDEEKVLENNSFITNNQVINENPIHIDNNINEEVNVTKDIQNNNTNIDLDSILVSKDSVIEKNVNKEDNLVNNNILDNILTKKEEVKEDNKITYDTLVNIEVEKPKERKSFIIGTKMGYALGVLILVFALFGSTYAFFNYYKEDTRQADITTGEAYVRVLESNLNLSLTNQYPRTNEEARSRTDNYIDFNLVAKNTSLTKVLGYKFTLSHGTTDNNRTRISDDYILFDLAELDGSNNETLLLSGVSLSSFNSANISGFYVPTNQTTELQRKYRVRAWISEDVTISDDPEENATYTQAQYANLYGNFTLHVNSQDRVLNIGYEAVMKAINSKINNNVCNPIWIDDMGTTEDTTDDITYFSGTNDCVDMNYVWYSGKLWRITAIYPDGAMKLITQNNITSIAYNENNQVNFYTDVNTKSYMYQWLNEEFYDTLYNASEYIDTTRRWNATMPSNTTVSTKPKETNMIHANVGLLNSYEYYNSYRCIDSVACTGSSYSTDYLNIGYYWWLLNPYSASEVRLVSQNGSITRYYSYVAHGVRPSIYLKSDVEFTGSGTSDNPYKIVGDKGTGNANELVNKRLSGEYVKIKNGNNEQVFRIIDVEDNKTKIIAMNYADNNATRVFATSTGNTLWGSGTTTGAGTWYTYLNTPTTGYLAVLQSTYGDLFTSGTYYLGASGYNYKLSVCANTTSGSTKMCTKTTQIGTFDIGLPRYGEMFATQQAGGEANSIQMRIMNGYSDSYVWSVYTGGRGMFNDSPTAGRGARPTLHLKPTVIIKSGSGTESDPYVVGLPNNS